ncbi:hypothetical protein [Massilia sp. Mn16-1_5]|uniref:hypothetical protein n=1 Tax=Massilia sp. Mn16-1_5 TaxID=2079199 RepID=UPI00109E7C8B|nr:hypothetical protein [Massilia sp. Mn16-1_5]THC41666.1 hypothetical protein C2862_18345 [Massilia sp. Mn16-1_5]
MDDQQNNSPLSADTQATPHAPLDAKGVARRRFARASAGATGVILTLHSQPGMATFSKTLCKSPSGYMSMKPGASARPQVSCSYNRSHGYWKNHPDEWKTSAGMDSSAKFSSFFRCTGAYVGLANVTMMQVINPSQAIKRIDRNNVAMQCVAALLNGRAARFAGLPTVLPDDQVVEIWNQFVTRGYYTPTKGAMPWNGAVIAAYLESTFR